MKKIYLLMMFLLPIFAFSQGSMDFEGITLPETYDDGTFTENGVKYSYGHSRDQENYPINGQGLMLRRASDSYFEMKIPDGVGQLSFQYRKAFTAGGNPRELEVIVNGTALPITTGVFGGVSGEVTDIFTYTADIDIVADTVAIRIKNVGTATTNKQAVIDNIEWTSSGGISTSTSTLTGFHQFLGNPSAEKTVDVSGSALTDDIVVTVTSGDYEIATTSGGPFGPTVTLPQTSGAVASTTIYVRLNGTAEADPSNGVLTLTSTDVTDKTVTLEGKITPLVPTIVASESSIIGFSHFVGTPSDAKEFDVEGFNLTDDITITAPTNFEVSTALAEPFSSTVTLTQTSGAVASTTIYVRLNGATANPAQAGNITLSSSGVTETIALEGETLDYTVSTIGAVTNVDANGVGTSVGDYVTLTGVVHCLDFRNNGYDLVIIDENNDGITMYSPSNVSGYTNPVEGDKITVQGQIDQFNGLLQISPASITVDATGQTLQTPTSVTTALDESTESQYIQLDNVTLVNNETTWAANTNISVTDGTNTFTVRIPNDSPLAGTSIPSGPLKIVGVGKQFDNSSPYDSGYQLYPCSVTTLCNVDASTVLNEATITATSTATGLTYQWIDCSDDSPIAGATDASFTASASGSYAVIVTDGICSEQSACVAVNIASLTDNEFAGVSVYPNPVEHVLNITNENGVIEFVEVVSTTGNIVYSSVATSSNVEVNTSNLDAGVYFVNVKTAHGVRTYKVIK